MPLTVSIHSPSRRRFLEGVSTAVLSSTLPACGARGGRPNILWIIAEDLCPDLGCYGNKLVQTPNIDRLASEGIRFTRAFTTAPVCSASRSGILAGMYQTATGGHNHRSHRDAPFHPPEGVRPFTHRLQEIGYHTSNLVKIENGIGGTGKTDINYETGRIFQGTDWRQRVNGQPFYAQINFTETHRSFHRFAPHPVNPDDVRLPPYYPDHPAAREDWAMYLDTAQHLDVKVGRLLDRLAADGLVDSTVVFFFGDHGRPMPRGKQFLYDGGIHIPLIARIPQEFRLAVTDPGTVNEELISAIDITATTLALAGMEIPKSVQGRMIFGRDVEKRRYIFAARDRCDETVDRIRAVRDKRYKYIRNYYPDRPYAQQNNYKDTSYPMLAVMRMLKQQGKLDGPPALFMADTRPREEFYDLDADPNEIHNLAGGATPPAAMKEMSDELDRWIKESPDLGETPEPDIPASEKLRKKIDGWCATASAAETRNSVCRFQLEGKNCQIERAYIADPGQLRFEMRMRSAESSLTYLAYGLITDVDNPKNKVPIEFVKDGKWHKVATEFEAKDWLGRLQILFSNPGKVEIDWIRLSRNSAGKTTLVERWDFA